MVGSISKPEVGVTGIRVINQRCKKERIFVVEQRNRIMFVGCVDGFLLASFLIQVWIPRFLSLQRSRWEK